MTDRVPGAPGQYKAVVTEEELTKMQAGEPFNITMTRDDQPIVEGTPYSKAAVLPDELAAMLCPDVEDPTPADALAGLLPLSGGTMKGPLTLAQQNLTGFSALNGVRMGGFRFDLNTTCKLPVGDACWAALVAVKQNLGDCALYFLAGKDGSRLDNTFKIAGTEKNAVAFAVSGSVLTVTCTEAWSTGWYIASSVYHDMPAG